MRGLVGEQRRLLGASVRPYAALWLAREAPALLRLMEASGQRMIRAGNVRVGRELTESAAEIRAAALGQREANRASQRALDDGAVSAGGNAEVPPEAEKAGSGATSYSSGLSTRVVAEQLGLTKRQVCNLIAPKGPLVGHLSGRAWVIDELSVAAEMERRARRAEA